MGFLTFTHESASAYLDFQSIDLALLCNVEADMPGLGDGTGLIKKICAYCDQHDMAVYLYVRSDGPVGCMSNEQLVAWYGKFGFKLTPSHPDLPPQMIRYPKEIPSPHRSSFSSWFRNTK